MERQQIVRFAPIPVIVGAWLDTRKRTFVQPAVESVFDPKRTFAQFALDGPRSQLLVAKWITVQTVARQTASIDGETSH